MMAAPQQNDDPVDVGVRISIREIYDHVRDLVRNVDILSRQIDRLTTDVNMSSQGTNTLETRIRALETQKVVTPASMWSALAVLGTLAGVLITLITLMMRN